MKELIKRGININLRNDHYFSPLHVAMSSGSLQAVNILLDAGAEVSHSLKFMENADIPIEIQQRLNQYSQQNNMKPASTADGEKYGRLVETQDVLYFTYGSLKKGFPNFNDHADIPVSYTHLTLPTKA